MSALHLALEIDSEVHPELYALLVALHTEAARAERLRHLAGCGLVWETVRQHGYPKVLPPPAAATPPAAPAPADYVDLAISAAPADPELQRAVEIAVSELPVLHEVVHIGPPPLEPDPEPAPAAPEGTVVAMPPAASAPATRNRLKRMKDKGLFKNG